ncbi:MAG: glycoside hydrolase family 2 [Mariniphaga sp.]|nr:glycoside hydrolase family 2 [Mariniphaga sp.]
MSFNTILFFILIMIGSGVYSQNNNNQIYTNSNISIKSLREDFINPPDESKLRCYWWWLNSMATKESITRDLEEMKAKGYGGASLVDAGSSSYDIANKTKAGPVFMSPEWMKLYKHAVSEASRIGIELSVNVQSGWNPGGPAITPEYALKKLVWSETKLTGNNKIIEIILPMPDTNLIYKDICAQAIKINSSNTKQTPIKNWAKKTMNESLGWKGIYPLFELRENFPESDNDFIIQKNNIIDISAYLNGNNLSWKAPEGNWLIIRYGYTCTGAYTSTTSDGWGGLSLDHLSGEAFEIFSKEVIKPLIVAAKQAGNSVKFLQTDSWEMGPVNWTKFFPEEFKKRREYDIYKYLPVLAGKIVKSRDVSNRFLFDFRKTIGDCIADNHYQPFYNLAHENGMGIHPESGGPHSAPVDALKILGISDFPQGEFWARSNTHRILDAERLAVKQSACVAHTNGKKYVAAEGPTSIGPQWERAPKDLKNVIDRIFCSGVNRIVWHTFTSSPKEFGLPGNEYFAGTHLNPNVTWWEHAPAFINYLNRSSYLLSQGLFVADVLYYYGDDVPNFVFLKDEVKELNFGYDWDKCSKEVILNKLTFQNGKIILPDGMNYRLLVLPNEETINLEVLKKVEYLVKVGMTVIAPRPIKTTGLKNFPEADKEIQNIAEKLWGNIDGNTITENIYGKGKVIWGQDINHVLNKMGGDPDFQFTSSQKNTGINYIHRSTENNEIYFVVNQYARKEIRDFEYRYLNTLPNQYELVECKFRVTGKIPELWDPKTGKQKEILTWREEDGYTIIPLFLEPEGSVFVVFKEGDEPVHITTININKKSYFPNNQLEIRNTPYIDLYKTADNYAADIFIQGKYELTWSDGQISQLNTKNKSNLIVDAPWEVTFDKKLGGPGKTQFHKLISWIDSDDENIKYYSGTAIYKNHFKLEKEDIDNTKLVLDLGNVQEMASVIINGNQLPVQWISPFRFNITPFIKQGNNEIKVEVVNMWPNRLIGDSKLPKEKRITNTNVNKFYNQGSEKYLRASGLIGPVKIIKVTRTKIR